MITIFDIISLLPDCNIDVCDFVRLCTTSCTARQIMHEYDPIKYYIRDQIQDKIDKYVIPMCNINNIDAIMHMMSFKININRYNSSYYVDFTTLHLAIQSASQYGYLDLLKYLISLIGNNPSANLEDIRAKYKDYFPYDGSGNYQYRFNSALEVASSNGHLNIIEYMVSLGINCNDIYRSSSAVYDAVMYERINVIKYFISLVDSSDTEEMVRLYMSKILHVSQVSGSERIIIIKYLVSVSEYKPIVLAYIREQGTYFLHEIIIYTLIKLAKYLLSLGISFRESIHAYPMHPNATQDQRKVYEYIRSHTSEAA